MRLFSLILSTLLLAACASAPSPLGDTQDIAAQFCLMNQQPGRALGDTPSLTPALAKAIMEAEEKSFLYNLGYAPAVPQSAAGASAETAEGMAAGVIDPALTVHDALCRPGRVFTVNGVRYVEIHHGPQGEKTQGWTDRLVLRRSGSEWKIDDILFAPDYKEGVRAALMRSFSGE